MSSARQPSRWIVLGSGASVRQPGMGNKARLLDLGAKDGLPVPAGIILLDEAFQEARHAGLVEQDEGAVKIVDHDALLALLDLPAFARPIAVRSAFALEDTADQSLAGYFTTRLNVDARDPAALADALAEVWGSGERMTGRFRRDVLLLQMVQPTYAGVAFTEQEHEDDLVNVVAGTADTLVSGAVEGEALLLPKLRAWERPDPTTDDLLPPYAFAARLQALLRDVREAYGPGDWDVEWADDDECCWLIQIRPVSRPSRRDEAFTLANHTEILPELPSRFMASLVEASAPKLFEHYRRFDPSLPAHRPFIELFLGRPYINLSLLSEMMRSLGLPTRLVTDSIGGEGDRPVGTSIGRLFHKAPVLGKMGLAQLTAVSANRATLAEIESRSREPGHTFGACVETLSWLYATLVGGMMALTAAMSGPLATLRAAGILGEHSSRHRTVATGIYDDLAPLRVLVQADPRLLGRIQRGEIPQDPRFQTAWQAYLAQHGHRGIFESDIARPRFREDPAPLLAALSQPEPARGSPPPRTLQGTAALPIWWQASRAMRAREQLRSTTMRAFERVRRRLLDLADEAVARGVLPDREALWSLTVQEASRLDTGWEPGAAFFAERAAEIERLAEYHLPDLIHRSDDLEQYRAGHADRDDRASVHGVSLVSGELRGRAWVLREPSTALPDGFEAAGTILVARSVDAGWIPTFGLVAGVVVETGGDLSHGSIVLREIGRPAITNARGATAVFRTGNAIWLRAASGIAERIEPEHQR